jgi:addiction module HigA family antidote
MTVCQAWRGWTKGADGPANVEAVGYHFMTTRPSIHPGEHLAEQLEALRMSAAELARQLKVPTNRFTHILNGQRAITGDTADGELRWVGFQKDVSLRRIPTGKE